MHRTWVEIDLAQIAANYRALQALAGPAVTLAPVVKANAYGHGAARVAQALAEAGASWLAVSNAEEGVALRQAGLSTRILVMGDWLPFEREALAACNLTPVVHALEEIAAAPSVYHLKADTGMGRLGTRAEARVIAAAVQARPEACCEGLMGHFASPDIDAPLAAFLALEKELEALGVAPRHRHIAASMPLARGFRAAWRNMVRPGIALYGYPDIPIPGVRPALTWYARVVEIKDLPAGATVGYNAWFRAERPTRIAVAAAGYADGVPYQARGKLHVLAAGKLAPVAGAISMDLITIDVTDCPPLERGDAVTLLGDYEGLTAADIAAAAGTIPYDVLCGLGNRVQRVYI